MGWGVVICIANLVLLNLIEATYNSACLSRTKLPTSFPFWVPTTYRDELLLNIIIQYFAYLDELLLKIKSNFTLINYAHLFSAHLCKAGLRKRQTRLGLLRRYPSRRRRPDRRRRFPKNETENRRNKIIRSSDRQKLRRNLLLQIQKGKNLYL